MALLAGIDIGGTKCAVSLANGQQDELAIIDKQQFPTNGSATDMIALLIQSLSKMLSSTDAPLTAIGISCGGPLNSRTGTILSPPNLPGWDEVPIVSLFETAFAVPVFLQNDANACALAEWRWGAGKGCRNMIFLTFGTGMGAGLILDGKIYSGTNDMAGEIGHVRMAADGPIGYGKAGSFEGFCSGGGIAQLGKRTAQDRWAAGTPLAFASTPEEIAELDARKIAESAQAGDPHALEIMHTVAEQLGRGLAILIDLLNPELIVIGSIYIRQQALLEPLMAAAIAREALALSRSVCRIAPAGLGEQVGDYAGLSVAMQYLQE